MATRPPFLNTPFYCSHRGTSLEFGQLSERGIRCCYHGWLFDADGTILETPGEPSDSTLKDRLYHGAYPTLEYQGIIFGYMGPPDKQPAFPRYDCFDLPGYCLKPMPKHVYPCNWLQVKENSMDPAHLDFLHTIEGNIGFSRDLRLRSELDWMETPVGMLYMSTRRVGDSVWVRIGEAAAAGLSPGAIGRHAAEGGTVNGCHASPCVD